MNTNKRVTRANTRSHENDLPSSDTQEHEQGQYDLPAGMTQLTPNRFTPTQLDSDQEPHEQQEGHDRSSPFQSVHEQTEFEILREEIQEIRLDVKANREEITSLQIETRLMFRELFEEIRSHRKGDTPIKTEDNPSFIPKRPVIDLTKPSPPADEPRLMTHEELAAVSIKEESNSSFPPLPQMTEAVPKKSSGDVRNHEPRPSMDAMFNDRNAHTSRRKRSNDWGKEPNTYPYTTPEHGNRHPTPPDFPPQRTHDTADSHLPPPEYPPHGARDPRYPPPAPVGFSPQGLHDTDDPHLPLSRFPPNHPRDPRYPRPAQPGFPPQGPRDPNNSHLPPPRFPIHGARDPRYPQPPPPGFTPNVANSYERQPNDITPGDQYDTGNHYTSPQSATTKASLNFNLKTQDIMKSTRTFSGSFSGPVAIEAKEFLDTLDRLVNQWQPKWPELYFMLYFHIFPTGSAAFAWLNRYGDSIGDYDDFRAKFRDRWTNSEQITEDDFLRELQKRNADPQSALDLMLGMRHSYHDPQLPWNVLKKYLPESILQILRGNDRYIGFLKSQTPSEWGNAVDWLRKRSPPWLQRYRNQLARTSVATTLKIGHATMTNTASRRKDDRIVHISTKNAVEYDSNLAITFAAVRNLHITQTRNVIADATASSVKD